MTKTAKQIITYDALLSKVQSLLASYPDCRNIHIDGIQVYPNQTDGANWHIDKFRRSGDDNDLTACQGKIYAEIRRLRECYDVVKEQ